MTLIRWRNIYFFFILSVAPVYWFWGWNSRQNNCSALNSISALIPLPATILHACKLGRTHDRGYRGWPPDRGSRRNAVSCQRVQTSTQLKGLWDQLGRAVRAAVARRTTLANLRPASRLANWNSFLLPCAMSSAFCWVNKTIKWPPWPGVESTSVLKNRSHGSIFNPVRNNMHGLNKYHIYLYRY